MATHAHDIIQQIYERPEFASLCILLETFKFHLFDAFSQLNPRTLDPRLDVTHFIHRPYLSVQDFHQVFDPMTNPTPDINKSIPSHGFPQGRTSSIRVFDPITIITSLLSMTPQTIHDDVSLHPLLEKRGFIANGDDQQPLPYTIPNLIQGRNAIRIIDGIAMRVFVDDRTASYTAEPPTSYSFPLVRLWCDLLALIFPKEPVSMDTCLSYLCHFIDSIQHNFQPQNKTVTIHLPALKPAVAEQEQDEFSEDPNENTELVPYTITLYADDRRNPLKYSLRENTFYECPSELVTSEMSAAYEALKRQSEYDEDDDDTSDDDMSDDRGSSKPQRRGSQRQYSKTTTNNHYNGDDDETDGQEDTPVDEDITLELSALSLPPLDRLKITYYLCIHVLESSEAFLSVFNEEHVDEVDHLKALRAAHDEVTKIEKLHTPLQNLYDKWAPTFEALAADLIEKLDDEESDPKAKNAKNGKNKSNDDDEEQQQSTQEADTAAVDGEDGDIKPAAKKRKVAATKAPAKRAAPTTMRHRRKIASVEEFVSLVKELRATTATLDDARTRLEELEDEEVPGSTKRTSMEFYDMIQLKNKNIYYDETTDTKYWVFPGEHATNLHIYKETRSSGTFVGPSDVVDKKKISKPVSSSSSSSSQQQQQLSPDELIDVFTQLWNNATHQQKLDTPSKNQKQGETMDDAEDPEAVPTPSNAEGKWLFQPLSVRNDDAEQLLNQITQVLEQREEQAEKQAEHDGKDDQKDDQKSTTHTPENMDDGDNDNDNDDGDKQDNANSADKTNSRKPAAKTSPGKKSGSPLGADDANDDNDNNGDGDDDDQEEEEESSEQELYTPDGNIIRGNLDDLAHVLKDYIRTCRSYRNRQRRANELRDHMYALEIYRNNIAEDGSRSLRPRRPNRKHIDDPYATIASESESDSDSSPSQRRSQRKPPSRRGRPSSHDDDDDEETSSSDSDSSSDSTSGSESDDKKSSSKSSSAVSKAKAKPIQTQWLQSRERSSKASKYDMSSSDTDSSDDNIDDESDDDEYGTFNRSRRNRARSARQSRPVGRRNPRRQDVDDTDDDDDDEDGSTSSSEGGDSPKNAPGKRQLGNGLVLDSESE